MRGRCANVGGWVCVWLDGCCKRRGVLCVVGGRNFVVVGYKK